MAILISLRGATHGVRIIPAADRIVRDEG